MKSNQFKTLVKEIIKEVINETDSPEADVDLTGVDVPPVTSKSDKRWRGRMRAYTKFKDEPGVDGGPSVNDKIAAKRSAEDRVEPVKKKDDTYA